MTIEINIFHKSNLCKKYIVSENALKKSKVLYNNFIVTEGTEEALEFVVKYLNYYIQLPEIEAPEIPLAENAKLEELFEYEIMIFGNYIFDINKEKIKNISDIILVANQLYLEILVKKLACIMAFHLINKKPKLVKNDE